jgi:transposase InsO family protein
MDSAKSEKIALFRYGLIAPLVLEVLPRGELVRRARELAARPYDIPGCERTTVSVDTLLSWARRYRQQGFPGLQPRPRSDRGRSRVLTPELAQQIEHLKRENPHRNGVLLLQQLAGAIGQSSPPLSASTLYRFLRQRGLNDPQPLMATTDRKKFEAESANQIWQSDLLFGPYVERPGGGQRQAFLYAILDDASRLVPHAQFYAHQGLEGLLDCLRQAVAARGLPLRLYVDNGQVYHSLQLARIAASLGILLVHTPPYQPQGRGKIERFFRSLREQFLASLNPQPRLSLEELNRRLGHWLETVYHRSLHSALGTTPLLRWQRDIEQVRQLPPATDLHRLFFFRLLRLVRRDATFLLGNRFYEAPAHLVGQRVEVRFDPLDPAEVDLYGNGQLEGVARPVDVRVNAQLPRSRAALADPPNRKE